MRHKSVAAALALGRPATAHGWAIMASNTIDVRTVSEARRAAIINWLVIEKTQWVTNNHTDAQVEEMWERFRKGADVVRVTISCALEARR